MYKMVQNKLPLPVKNTFIKNQELHKHNTRQGVHIKFRRTKVASCQISHKGPEVWLNIPNGIQTSKNINQFKYKYKRLLQQAYLWLSSLIIDRSSSLVLTMLCYVMLCPSSKRLLAPLYPLTLNYMYTSIIYPVLVFLSSSAPSSTIMLIRQINYKAFPIFHI